MNPDSLTDRQRDLLRATVHAWESTAPGPPHQPLRLDGGLLEHPNWPEDVARPRTREEFRPLILTKWLLTSGSKRDAWLLSPSTAALDTFGTQQRNLTVALCDADERLGAIHEAVVTAYEADPREPLHLAVMDAFDVVRHPHWPLPPDAVQRHDFELLQHAGLVLMTPRGMDYAIAPTQLGRDVVQHPERALETAIEQAISPERRSRLQALLDKLRAGEVAANAVGGSIANAVTAIVGALAQ